MDASVRSTVTRTFSSFAIAATVGESNSWPMRPSWRTQARSGRKPASLPVKCRCTRRQGTLRGKIRSKIVTKIPMHASSPRASPSFATTSTNPDTSGCEIRYHQSKEQNAAATTHASNRSAATDRRSGPRTTSSICPSILGGLSRNPARYLRNEYCRYPSIVILLDAFAGIASTVWS